MNPSVSKVRAARLDFYSQRGKIHARAASGRFNRLRWAMVWLTQAIFYGACWLNWESGGVARQAVWFDIAHEKFYLFGLVLWPQDALLLAFVLIASAAGLFLVTALAGRLFCGFACPQTVYTQIFTWVEARVEGDHLARLKLDQAPWGPRKLVLKVLKHGLWALIAVWTAITFVGYFTPIRELLPALGELRTGPWEFFWLIFYAAFTYVQAGLAREAVCQHMCPYSRFQGVMFDPVTRNVAYDAARGEPRGARRHEVAAAAASAAPAGDCVDCGLCVQVCPTGIDIRDGLQYQCINCGLCIDACDRVMDRLGAPRGLIRFAPEASAADRPWLRRPRVGVYAGLLAVCVLLVGWQLQQRSLLRVDVLRDRGALARETADGLIENAYTLKLMNLSETPRRYRVTASGLAQLQVVGEQEFAVAPGSLRPVSLTLAAPAGEGSGLVPISLRIVALDDPATAVDEKSTFAQP